jgi:hypothetical protein
LEGIKLLSGVNQVHVTGSRYYTGHDKGDYDILVLCSSTDSILLAGYEVEKIYDNGTTSLRKGECNLICLYDAVKYRRWVLAAEVCKALKLDNKADVIKVHDLVVKGG